MDVTPPADMGISLPPAWNFDGTHHINSCWIEGGRTDLPEEATAWRYSLHVYISDNPLGDRKWGILCTEQYRTEDGSVEPHRRNIPKYSSEGHPEFEIPERVEDRIVTLSQTVEFVAGSGVP